MSHESEGFTVEPFCYVIVIKEKQIYEYKNFYPYVFSEHLYAKWH